MRGYKKYVEVVGNLMGRGISFVFDVSIVLLEIGLFVGIFMPIISGICIILFIVVVLIHVLVAISRRSAKRDKQMEEMRDALIKFGENVSKQNLRGGENEL